jgi:hypothetical protein
MTDSTTHARADDAAYLRWIGVLGLAPPGKDGLRPASLPSLICRAPGAHVAAESIIYVDSPMNRSASLA